jgi:fructose-specific phosphotransferase system IIC component
MPAMPPSMVPHAYHSVLPSMMTPLLGEVVIGLVVLGLVGLVIGHRIHRKEITPNT